MSKASQRTRERMILVAEGLVTRSGIGGVSAREIATAAGLQNNSSVHYHFGSMEGLFEQVVRYRMGQLERTRSEMLARAEASDRLADIRALIEIVCLPHVGLRDDAGGFPYAGFLCQYLPRYHPRGFPWIMQGGNPEFPSLGRTLALLSRKLDYVPDEFVFRRITAATLMFLNVLLAYEDAPDAILENGEPGPAVQDALTQIAAGISAPCEVTIPSLLREI